MEMSKQAKVGDFPPFYLLLNIFLWSCQSTLESFLASVKKYSNLKASEAAKNPLFSVCPQAVERTEDKACFFRFPGLYFVFIGTCLPAVQSRRWISYLSGCWLGSSSSSSSSSSHLPYLLGETCVCSPAPCPGLTWSIRDIYILYISIYWEEKKRNAAKNNYCLEF